jgi:L-cystine uptake protein TcyP (sodium:dicarboxylate symporter family)
MQTYESKLTMSLRNFIISSYITMILCIEFFFHFLYIYIYEVSTNI